MPSFPKPFGPRRVVVGALALMGLSTAAWAFPWDIDMVDALYKKAYGWKMMTPPEGAVSRNRFSQNHDRTTPEGAALVNPLQSSPETLKQGERMFTVYCAVCHGANREGGVGLPLTPDVLTQEASVYEDVVMNGRSGTAMTSMGTNLGLSTEEVATLVHFLQTVEP